MENASKALIIAAEVLFGVLLVTVGLFIFRAMGDFSDTVEDNIEQTVIRQFNAQYEEYLFKHDKLTAQDVVTLGNLAKNYNDYRGEIAITVKVNNVESKFVNAHALTDKDIYEFINQYSVKNEIYFTCKTINYNPESGKIDNIVLAKN